MFVISPFSERGMRLECASHPVTPFPPRPSEAPRHSRIPRAVERTNGGRISYFCTFKKCEESKQHESILIIHQKIPPGKTCVRLMEGGGGGFVCSCCCGCSSPTFLKKSSCRKLEHENELEPFEAARRNRAAHRWTLSCEK